MIIKSPVEGHTNALGSLLCTAAKNQTPLQRAENLQASRPFHGLAMTDLLGEIASPDSTAVHEKLTRAEVGEQVVAHAASRITALCPREMTSPDCTAVHEKLTPYASLLESSRVYANLRTF